MVITLWRHHCGVVLLECPCCLSGANNNLEWSSVNKEGLVWFTCWNASCTAEGNFKLEGWPPELGID